MCRIPYFFVRAFRPLLCPHALPPPQSLIRTLIHTHVSSIRFLVWSGAPPPSLRNHFVSLRYTRNASSITYQPAILCALPPRVSPSL